VGGAHRKALHARLTKYVRQLVITEGRFAGQRMRVLGWQNNAYGAVVDHNTLAISMARGNGKTAWASALGCSALDPGGPLFLPRGEIVMVASSHGQARIAFRHVFYFMRPIIEAAPRDEWRVRDSTQLSQIEHRPSGTVLKALGSDPKRAHGLAPTLIIADEPAKWIGGGREMYVALDTSRGKQMFSKFVAIGTRPQEPEHWFSELLAATDPDTWAINHCAEKGEDDFAIATIKKANPSYHHMKDLRDVLKKDAERAKDGGSYLHAWRALRLNMGTPEVEELERLVALEDWEACTMPDPPKRAGPVFVGIDLGGGTSMSAVSFYWPECGRLEAYGAFPAHPGLAERGKQDFVGDRYVRMRERGELFIYPGMATNNIRFLEDMFNRIAEEQVGGIGADRYKDKDLKHVLLALGRNPDNDVEWRGVGHGPDGMADVGGFQREVLEGVLKTRESLILASAINDAVLHRHPNGYPTLDKRRFKGRIDVMQASVIAVGMGHRYRCPPEAANDYAPWKFVL